MPTPKKLPKTLPITPEQECQLWENKQLSLESSAGLIHAVIFYLIKCFGVWQGKYLKLLTTEHVKYDEDRLGKFVTIDTTSIAKAGKVIRRYDDPENPRSLYKIIKIYQGYLANEGPLLVRPISSIKDYICYSPWPLGVGIVDQTTPNLLKELGDGQLYTNASISLMAIDILKNMGVGSHCMGTWTQQLYSLFTRSNPKDVFDVCIKTNCEKKNLNLCLLISRLLDPPYPPDRPDVAEMEKKKLQLVDAFFDSQLKNFSNLHPEDDDVIYEKTEEIDKDSKTKRSPDTSGNKKTSSQSKRQRLSKRGSRSCSEAFSPRIKKRKFSKDFPDKGLRKKSSTADKSPVKIMSVSSIPESSFSFQDNEGKMSSLLENAEGAKDKVLLLESIKKEKADEGDDLPLTFIKKEIIDDPDSETNQELVSVEDHADLLAEVKVDIDDDEWSQGGNLVISEPHDMHSQSSTDSAAAQAAVPTPPVDSILLLRTLWKQESGHKPHDFDGGSCNLSVTDTNLGMNVDLSPPVLSPQTKSTDEDQNIDQEAAFQCSLPPCSSQPTADASVKTSPPPDNGASVASANLPEPESFDSHKARESQFVLSNFPSNQSTKISTSPFSSFPLLRYALETARPPEAIAILPSQDTPHPAVKRRRLRVLKRRKGKVLSSWLCNSTNLKQRLKSKIATSSNSSNAEDTLPPKQPSASSSISGNNVPVHPPNSSLLNSPVAQLQPQSGIYHLSSDQEKQAAYQTVKIRTDSGTKLFTIGDQQIEQSASSVVLTSETNIGDYFPEGTMIPASGLKLLTRNGSNGLEVLLKFEYVSGNSQKIKRGNN